MEKTVVYKVTSNSTPFTLVESGEYVVDLIDAQGYFFTPQELENMLREVFKSGEDSAEVAGPDEDNYIASLNIEK